MWLGAPLLVENAKQVQKDNHEDWHTGQPQDDVAKHGIVSFQVVEVVRRRWSAKVNRAGTELSR